MPVTFGKHFNRGARPIHLPRKAVRAPFICTSLPAHACCVMVLCSNCCFNFLEPASLQISAKSFLKHEHHEVPTPKRLGFPTLESMSGVGRCGGFWAPVSVRAAGILTTSPSPSPQHKYACFDYLLSWLWRHLPVKRILSRSKRSRSLH